MIQLFPHRLIAGYVLSNATSLKSMMAIEGTEPSDFSHSEGEVIIPNTAVIERAITAHIAAKLPESEGKVAVTLTGTASEIEITLVTQECLLAKVRDTTPLSFDQNPLASSARIPYQWRPWATGRNVFVSGWGATVTRPCYRSLLCSILTVSTGIGGDEYQWDTRSHGE